MKYAIGLGGISTNDASSIISLSALASTLNYYDTFECPVGIDYQVPTGKILVIGFLSARGLLAESSFNIGYGNDGVDNSASAPTSYVALNDSLHYIKNALEDTDFKTIEIIPANKYPCIQAKVGNVAVRLVGLLLDV